MWYINWMYPSCYIDIIQYIILRDISIFIKIYLKFWYICLQNIVIYRRFWHIWRYQFMIYRDISRNILIYPWISRDIMIYLVIFDKFAVTFWKMEDNLSIIFPNSLETLWNSLQTLWKLCYSRNSSENLWKSL